MSIPLVNSTTLLALNVLIIGNFAGKPCCSQEFLFEDVPYLCFEDSPLSSLVSVVLEDYEDELFDIPGVTAVSNQPGTELGIGGGSPFSDSVDGDDGIVDGVGFSGRSMSEASNLSTDNLGYTFTFDESVIGHLPTHAGIVWTDGSFSAPTQVEFFDADGKSLGVLGPFHISDSTFADSVTEDRFFGCIFYSGISSFTIRSPGGGNNMSVDHVQYAVELLGDVNCDGTVNLLDFEPFIDAIATGIDNPKADTNQDGDVNLLDFEPFIVILGS